MSNEDSMDENTDQIEPGDSPDSIIEYYEDIDEETDGDDANPDIDDIDWDDD